METAMLTKGQHVLCDGIRYRVVGMDSDPAKVLLVRLNKNGSVNMRCCTSWYVKPIADCTPIEEGETSA